jgi:iron complex transport system ATP-binding protein
MTPPLVQARHLVVQRGNTRILDDVNLDIEAGVFLAIVGPNGAGKSTLLHALAGDPVLSHGTVAYRGQSTHRIHPRQLAQHRAVLLQDTTIASGFTVQEVVRMGRAPVADIANDDTVVHDVMEETEVAHLADRQYRSLSGGERARAALARILAQQSPLLLLDEPTAALDLRHEELVLEIARRRAEMGISVVAVLHDLDAAAAHAGVVAIMQSGRLAALGPPREVLTSPRLTSIYQHPVHVSAAGSSEIVIRPGRRCLPSPVTDSPLLWAW